jgi:hypothetical protein
MSPGVPQCAIFTHVPVPIGQIKVNSLIILSITEEILRCVRHENTEEVSVNINITFVEKSRERERVDDDLLEINLYTQKNELNFKDLLLVICKRTSCKRPFASKT